MTRRHAIKFDPGGEHTGLCLVERTAFGLMPLDGLTVDRTHEERDTIHTGCPRYVQRVIAAGLALLDKHDVADDDLDTYVETLLPPKPLPQRRQPNDPKGPGKPFFSPKVGRDVLGAWAVLGGVAAVWPDAYLVAPADHDHAAAGYPAVLRGRTPAGWTRGGGSARVHQRAAWAMGLAGMRQQGLSIAVVPDEVEAAVRAVRAGGDNAMGASTLVGAVRRAAKPAASAEQIADWAMTAARIIRSDTPDKLGERLLALAAVGMSA